MKKLLNIGKKNLAIIKLKRLENTFNLFNRLYRLVMNSNLRKIRNFQESGVLYRQSRRLAEIIEELEEQGIRFDVSKINEKIKSIEDKRDDVLINSFNNTIKKFDKLR